MVLQLSRIPVVVHRAIVVYCYSSFMDWLWRECEVMCTHICRLCMHKYSTTYVYVQVMGIHCIYMRVILSCRPTQRWWQMLNWLFSMTGLPITLRWTTSWTSVREPFTPSHTVEGHALHRMVISPSRVLSELRTWEVGYAACSSHTLPWEGICWAC